ncbi:MAG: 30S ribosome-binding factor RbfA [Desulfobulbaceae bacterium]|nr:30S ribosome-binding factor RbfA [Desulfobulbaceae bacterium]
MSAHKTKSRFAVPELGEKVGRRPARVADAIREEIAGVLIREVKDPRLAMVAITSVSVSPDLRSARVLFSCAREESDRVAAGLESCKGFLRSHLARKLGLRCVPDLDFRYDLRVERQLEMERLLKEIAEQDEQSSR